VRTSHAGSAGHAARCAAAALAAMVFTLVACGRSGNGAGAQRSATIVAGNYPASANDGGRVYAANCASCHQADGRGVPGLFPPLASNPDVTGPSHRAIAAVKLGMRGKISANGDRYNGTMPRWGQMISDDDIAAVVTYIRTSWGNRADAVSPADVRAVSQ
jgi:mono/diheme cytochrome c family protein